MRNKRGWWVVVTVALLVATAMWVAVMWITYTAGYHGLTALLGVWGAIVALLVAIDAADL